MTVAIKRPLLIALIGVGMTIESSQFALAVINNGGGPGITGSECYNKVTENCNNKYPGKNLGDPVYKACIESGLDICDITTITTGVRRPILKAPTSRLQSR